CQVEPAEHWLQVNNECKHQRTIFLNERGLKIMPNLSVYDMLVCLENCHGVEEEYLIPATFAADGDPKKFEKVLAHFTDDRFQKFTDPTMRHEEECQIPYLLLPEKFTLEIEIGGSSMSTGENLALVLEGIAA